MNLLWIDLETTGLNPRHEQIIEIAAARAVFDDPFAIGPIYQRVIHLDPNIVMSPVVRTMHEKNGLLNEAYASTLTIAEVENELLMLVEDKMTLAGSSVHFDMAFLKVHMPNLASRLNYRIYDVSAVKLFAMSLGWSGATKKEAHRAEADIRESIQHAKEVAAWFRSKNGFPC